MWEARSVATGARKQLGTREQTRRPADEPAPAPAEGLLDLQRSAGNAAVAGLVQRALVRDAARHVTHVEFTVGQEVSLTLAQKAQQAAAGGVNDTELRKLRDDALGDDTINDDERMFLAGLLDAGNARTVSSARIAAGVKFKFARAAIEANMAHARDLDQETADPAIAAETAKAAAAQGAGSLTEWFGHQSAAIQAILTQATTLAGPAWTARTLDAFDYVKGKVAYDGVLDAMLNAASDDTHGDRAMAATVYAVAAVDGHSMAPMVRSGKIQIDQVGTIPGGEFAHYRATAGAGGGKGDTVTVLTTLSIKDVAHRSAVIHELTHAVQDNRSTAPRVEMADRERSELEAYRAGARYQLQQTAPLTLSPRAKAVGEIAGLLNEISLIALVLESRADPRAYEPVVKEVNAAWGLVPEPQLLRLMQQPDSRIEPVTLVEIGKAYGSRDAAGNPIPGANDLPIDALRGESLLDWVDRV